MKVFYIEQSVTGQYVSKVREGRIDLTEFDKESILPVGLVQTSAISGYYRFDLQDHVTAGDFMDIITEALNISTGEKE